MAKKNNTVDYLGNVWKKCLPISADSLLEIERKLKLELMEPLRELLLKCNGGVPEKTFFSNKRIEVEIGSLLPMQPPSSFKGESFETVLEFLRKSQLPQVLIPFAYDNGNAGVFCVNASSGEVVYWVHDEPEDPLKKIAPSLAIFLSNLTEPPY